MKDSDIKRMIQTFTYRFDFLAVSRGDPPSERTEVESSSSGEDHETEAGSSSTGEEHDRNGESSRREREKRSPRDFTTTRRSHRRRESWNVEPPRERKREVEPSTLTENDADTSKIQSTNAESSRERKRLAESSRESGNRVVEGERERRVQWHVSHNIRRLWSLIKHRLLA